MSEANMSEFVSRVQFARLEGCDEKQVRRGIERGSLTVNAEGKLAVAQVGSGWRRPRRDTRSASDNSDSSATSDNSNVRENVRENVRAPAGAPADHGAGGADLKRAVAHKEDFAGRMKELEYWRAAGALIEIDIAKRVLFDEFRAARDAWLNWPTRYAALIAAELGVDVDRVVATLTNYVHKQIATLGEEPSGQFREG